MSQPRPIVPGATHHITRRTVLRTHLFAPNDPRIGQVFLYALAVAAKRYDIEVHFAVLMSDHAHLVVTDVKGQLPAFLQFFHRIVALAIKVLRKWDGPVWDHRKPSVVELVTPEAVVEATAYGIANPVAAVLVARGEDWPGVTTRVDELGRAVWRIERPDVYFDPENAAWPDVAELPITLPRAADDMGGAGPFRETVRLRKESLEAQARADVDATGGAFAGADRCRDVSPFRRARSWEPIRSLSPTFAAGRGRTDERLAAIARLRLFRAEYRAALARWRAGERDVCFPAGTWQMRVVHGVRVAPPIAA